MANKFLSDLMKRHGAQSKAIIEHDGVKFQVVKLDIFAMQEAGTRGKTDGMARFERISQESWKDIPGEEKGQSKWDEEMNMAILYSTNVHLVAMALRQSDGSPVYTNPKEYDMFVDYVRSEIMLWGKVQGAFGTMEESTGLKKKATRIPKKSS
jgi:hypothetical protein